MRPLQPSSTSRSVARVSKRASRLERRNNGAAGDGASGGIVWAQAAGATGYVAGDFYSGRSHDPLAYHYFSTTDPTTFEFNQNDYPGPGDGEVRILRSGLYVVRLTVAPSSLTPNADPGYTWDLALQARLQDNFSSYYMGMDPAPGSAYYSGAAYGFFLSPRDNFVTAGYTAPNGNSLQGAGQAQAPETAVFVNIDDAVVGPSAYPVIVANRFHHGLDNADVTVPSYALLVMRLADSNPDAPTG